MVTGLFPEGPLAGVRDRAAAVALLGAETFRFRPEYVGALQRQVSGGEVPAARELSFRDYWRLVDEAPHTRLMCVEEQTPDALAALAPTPRACAPGTGGIKSTVFVGNAGNHANLHFDGDCRHVLLYQVFGRKHVVMLPASASPSLRPVVNFATLQLQRLTDDERHALLARHGGWEVTIEAGEAILMPALVWHGVLYVDDGMSVNWRFGRHRYHDLLSEHLHLSPAVQRLGSATLREGDVEGAQRDLWTRLLDAFAAPWTAPRQLHDRIEALLADALPTEAAEPLRDDAYLPVADVVRETLLRFHLFNERLYVPRTFDASPWRPPLCAAR